MIINRNRGGGGLEPVNAVFSQMNEPCARYMAQIEYTGTNTGKITLDWDVPPTSWSVATAGAPMTVIGNGNVATVTCTGTTSAAAMITATNGSKTFNLVCAYSYIEGETWISFMGAKLDGNDNYYVIGDTTLQRPLGYQTGATENVVTVDRYAHRENAKSASLVYNITPSDKGGNFIAHNNGSISAVGNIVPTGQVRMIQMTPINVRDLGGWACDGGSIKYGLMFRGGEVSNVLTSDDIAMARNLLGIQAEVDLDSSGSQSQSSFGADIPYYYCGVNAYYKNGIDLSDQTLSAPWRQYVKAINAVFGSLKSQDPVYFHCQIGADRTGTLAFILEQLAGVSVYDSEKDYELTSFSQGTGGAGTRQRCQGYGGNLFAPMEIYLRDCSTSTLMRDCVVAWCVLAGIDINDINAYRKAVSTGTPSDVTAQIDYSVKKVVLSPSMVTVNVGQSATIGAAKEPFWSQGSIVWSSSDTTKATVSDGIVTGVSVGTVTITATCGNVSATATVTVSDAPPAPYTNLFVPDPSQLNLRLSSSGSTSAQNGSFVTNYIDISPYIENIRSGSCFMYIKGIKLPLSTSTNYWHTFKSDGTRISYTTSVIISKHLTVLDADTNYCKIDLRGVKDEASGVFSADAAQLRFNAYPNGNSTALTFSDISNIVVTIDEPIE